MKDLLKLCAFLVAVVVVIGRLDAPFGDAADEVVNLGVAAFPAGTPEVAATRHGWHMSRSESAGRYTVGYAHGGEAMAAVEHHQWRLARRFDYRRLSDDRFNWRGPDNCRGREWDCVYLEVYERSAGDLAPLLQRFRERATQERWSRTDTARWLLAFVQQIEYRLPDEHAFGLLPPALVASLSWGDCDSKSLLLMHLLAAFDIDAKLLTSRAHKHAMVAINVPGSGRGFRSRGREYLWAETTAPDAPLGYRDPRFSSPDDWQMVRSL